MKIGIFDSGIGGLTVLHEASKRLPDAEFLYYADLDNVPYGNKQREYVEALTLRAVRQMLEQDVDIILLACNTATSVAANVLREKWTLPIIGMEPAVKPAVMSALDKKTLVLATELTLKESKLKHLIDRLSAHERVDLLPMQELVMFAENMIFDKKRINELLSKKLEHLDLKAYGIVVLGCTHFVFYKEEIQSYLGETIRVIDGNEGTVNQLCRVLRGLSTPPHKKGKITYMVSGRLASSESFKGYFVKLNKPIIKDKASFL